MNIVCNVRAFFGGKSFKNKECLSKIPLKYISEKSLTLKYFKSEKLSTKLLTILPKGD